MSTTASERVTVDLGGRAVDVPKSGLYDRYRMNTDLAGTTRLPRGVDLELGTGRLSDDVRSLRPIRLIRLDVVTEGQLALHLPVPTSIRPR